MPPIIRVPGLENGTIHTSLMDLSYFGTGAKFIHTDASVGMHGSSYAVNQLGYIKSMDSNGFTITWT